MSLRKSLLGVVGIILVGGLGVFAQEPQTQTPSSQDGTLQRDRGERLERRRQRMAGREEMRKGMRHGRGAGRMLGELNLTDEQRQQGRAIMQRRLENLKPQREELFRLREKRMAGTFTADDEARARTLHQEMRTGMAGARSEMDGVLTAEQRAKLEGLRKERKERMEQRRKERQERWNNNNKPM
jgi:Spy/CpxP family protein refolding chaperone